MVPNIEAGEAYSKPLGLIGLGLMGQAMARRLLAAGFDIRGWDIRGEARAELRDKGGLPAGSTSEVFGTCERVILSLPDSTVVASVLETAGPLRKGLIIMDTSTGDPRVAEALAARLADKGVIYLDATVSGSSAQVADGSATLMVGGSAETVARCADVFACLGSKLFHSGAAGSGARMKLVTNLVLGLNRAALAEGLTLARLLELDVEKTLAVLRDSMAYSRIMDTKGQKMIREDFAPQAKLSQHLKDVRLMLEAAKKDGRQLPLSEAHRALLERAESLGWGDHDNSAIIKAFD